MPAPLFSELPVTPYQVYPQLSDIPKTGYKGVLVEPITVVLEPGARAYLSRIVFSPEDGPVQLCSVFLREDGGAMTCIADFSTKEQALQYAGAVGAARGLPVAGSIFDLRIREVPGKGYIADPREGKTFTLNPAKAALYNKAIATDDLFSGAAGEHGRWVNWSDATNHAVDRSAEKEGLLDRVFTAVRGAMGTSAPEAGSEDEQLLKGLLRIAVEDTRSDRLVIFDAPLRDYVCERLSDAYFDLAGHESDEDLCDMLVDLEGESLFLDIEDSPELVQQMLVAFASDAGAAAIHTSIARKPRLHDSGMVAEIHGRILEHGLRSPFAELFAEEPTAADTPTA